MFEKLCLELSQIIMLHPPEPDGTRKLSTSSASTTSSSNAPLLLSVSEAKTPSSLGSQHAPPTPPYDQQAQSLEIEMAITEDDSTHLNSDEVELGVDNITEDDECHDNYEQDEQDERFDYFEF